MRNGYGQQVWKNGDYCWGFWYDDKMHGMIKCYNKDEKLIHEEFYWDGVMDPMDNEPDPTLE